MLTIEPTNFKKSFFLNFQNKDKDIKNAFNKDIKKENY